MFSIRISYLHALREDIRAYHVLKNNGTHAQADELLAQAAFELDTTLDMLAKVQVPDRIYYLTVENDYGTTTTLYQTFPAWARDVLDTFRNYANEDNDTERKFLDAAASALESGDREGFCTALERLQNSETFSWGIDTVRWEWELLESME